MKTSVSIRRSFRTIFLALTLTLSMTASAQDDVYYIPSKEVRQVSTTDGTVISVQPSETVKAPYYVEDMDVDAYNRRGTVVAVGEDDYVYSDSIATVESTFDESTDVSYPYTKMVMRFHSPHVGYIVSSPYYWDICYGDVWDVYYDGWATYVPSYTYWSYAYDPWYYNRWHFRTCWDFTWGWYDPWYSRAYWGWGRPLYWGWSRPVYYHHHIGRPMWAHRGFDRGYAPGFGHHGGRTFAGRGFDGGRPAPGGRDGFGMGRGGGRQLSGVFRADRNPAMSTGGRTTGRNGQYAGSNTRRGDNNMARRNGGVVSRGGSGVDSRRSQGGYSPSRTPQQTQRQPSGSNRNNTPSTYNRGGSSSRSSTPSYGGGSHNSYPSSSGRSGGGYSSSPSHSGGGGVSRGSSGGGGVSRGGVSRGGRR